MGRDELSVFDFGFFSDKCKIRGIHFEKFLLSLRVFIIVSIG